MRQPDNEQEKVHLDQLKQGNSASFELLYHRYRPKLFAFCYHLTRSKSDAEEIVQQTFVKIWETRHRINPDLSFSSYLIQIAKNSIYNKSAQQIRDFAFREYFLATANRQDNTTEEQINLHTLDDILQLGVQKLPFMQRKVFLLSRMNGLSHQEIADRLQLSKSTVENHIFSALKTLRELLSRYHLYTPLIIFYEILS
ncbi:MAG: RNA polymerase sigma-70 factor [Bacteroidota bacterium]